MNCFSFFLQSCKKTTIRSRICAAQTTLTCSRRTKSTIRSVSDDFFTPSPFAKSSTLSVSEKFVVHRELREGNDSYGVRRYLLLPRTAVISENEYDHTDDHFKQEPEITKSKTIASLSANKNVIFGARLHIDPSSLSSSKSRDYVSQFITICGPLINLAKEDASTNGQQPQALAGLYGLSSWVRHCLDRNGEGSEVLTSIMHGGQENTLLTDKKKESSQVEGHNPSSISINSDSSGEGQKKSAVDERRNQKINVQSARKILDSESDRMVQLEAVRAIATGIPRPGHKVVGAGTYRDGKDVWISLAWEYSQLVSADPASSQLQSFNPLTEATFSRRGLEEVMLYKSRDGELATIEHLAHVEPEYLKDAGGAMARFFFT